MSILGPDGKPLPIVKDENAAPVNAKEQLEKIETAIIYLLRNQSKVFYASLIMQMIRIEEKAVGTMGVGIERGRIYLYYNPEFVAQLKLPEIVAVMEHEVLHLVMEHPFRKKHRYHPLWNLACDIAINQFIEQGLPKGVATYQDFNMKPDQAAEIYYNELMKNVKTIEMNIAAGKAGTSIDNHGKWMDSDKSDMDEDLQKEIVKQAIAEAYEQAQKSRGTMPGGLEQFIKRWLRKPEIPWKQLLRRYIGRSVKADSVHSWKRPNRRLGEEFKGLVPRRTIKVGIAIDTSGSVSEKDFQEFIAEMKGIQNCYKNEMTVMECDAQVQKVYQLKPYKQVDVKFKGRGGTDYEPVFKEIEEKHKYRPELLIYFTDFYCTFPTKVPKYKVLWVVTASGDKNNKPPFGGVIRIKHAAKGGQDED